MALERGPDLLCLSTIDVDLRGTGFGTAAMARFLEICGARGVRVELEAVSFANAGETGDSFGPIMRWPDPKAAS